jgi:hypothetical protein
MKKTLVLLSFAVILAGMATLAFPGSAVVTRGEVPFAFYVDNQLLPAGEYDFEMGSTGGATTSSVAVRTKDGSVLAFVATRPGSVGSTIANQLIFNRYNGRYFLSSVECSGHKASLKASKQEREMMSQLVTDYVALALLTR